jgi:hypothetical protein
MITYRIGEPCFHPSCLSHISHPCEGCGRIAGWPPEYIGLSLGTAYELQRKNLVPILDVTLADLLQRVTSFKDQKPIKLTATNYPTGFTLEMAYNVKVKFEFQPGMEFGVDIERSADNENAVLYLLRLK